MSSHVTARWIGIALVGLLIVAFTPSVDETVDLLRVLTIGMAAIITLVLISGAEAYWTRSRKHPGSTVLPGFEYLVLVACLLMLQAASTTVVIDHLVESDSQTSVDLVLCVLVQPVLLWWAIRMENRLREVQ